MDGISLMSLPSISNYNGTTRSGRRYSAGVDFVYDMDVSGRYICLAGMSSEDAYVAVLDDLTGIGKCFLGGSYVDQARSVACDVDQNVVFAVGLRSETTNPNFTDVIITRYNLTEPQYQQQVALNASGTEKAAGVAIGNGVVVVVGFTDSLDFPTTSGAFQTAGSGGYDAFVTVRNSTDLSASWTTLFGGSQMDQATAVAIDKAGYIYVCGVTNSSDLVMKFPKFANLSGMTDAFVAVFSPTGTLMHSTFFGGPGMDSASKLQVLDLPSGSHFILLAGVAEDGLGLLEKFYAYRGNQDVFVMAYALNTQYKSPDYMFGTYIGSSEKEEVSSISLLSNGVFAISGTTYGNSFPQTQPRNVTMTDGFYTVFNCSGLIFPSPSPSATPSASSSPSKAPSTVECSTNCYQVGGVVAQYGTGGDGSPVPTFTLYPRASDGQASPTTSLDVFFSYLEERSADGSSITSIPIPNTGYTMRINTLDVSGQNTTVVYFETALSNGAIFTVSNYLLENETQFNFAGFEVPIGDSSVKVTVNITNWPFLSSENTLLLAANYSMNPQYVDEPLSTILTDQVTQFEWTNGIGLSRIALVSVALADGSPVNVTSQRTPSSFEITLPFFTNSLLYDPTYTVLYEDETDQNSNNNKEEVSIWVYVGTFLGVVAVALVVGVAVLQYMVRRRKRQRANSKRVLAVVNMELNKDAKNEPTKI